MHADDVKRVEALPKAETSAYIGRMLYQPLFLNNLRRLFEAYSEVKGLGITAVQRSFAKDSAFLRRLEAGASLTASQYDRIVCRMAREWPAETVWPVDVPRPTPSQIRSVLNQ